jgi:hypothetical protein
MPITRTPIIDDSGSGTDGTVINNAWKQEFYNQIDAVLVAQTGPPWADIAYSAANFSATGGGTWTVAAGNQTTFIAAFDAAHKIVTVQGNFGNTSVAGTVTALRVTLPTSIGGQAVGLPVRATITPLLYHSGTTKFGLAACDVSGPTARLLVDFAGSAFATGTTHVFFNLVYPVA